VYDTYPCQPGGRGDLDPRLDRGDPAGDTQLQLLVQLVDRVTIQDMGQIPAVLPDQLAVQRVLVKAEQTQHELPVRVDRREGPGDRVARRGLLAVPRAQGRAVLRVQDRAVHIA
jgi:hypothetical protein